MDFGMVHQLGMVNALHDPYPACDVHAWVQESRRGSGRDPMALCTSLHSSDGHLAPFHLAGLSCWQSARVQPIRFSHSQGRFPSGENKEGACKLWPPLPCGFSASSGAESLHVRVEKRLRSSCINTERSWPLFCIARSLQQSFLLPVLHATY